MHANQFIRKQWSLFTIHSIAQSNRACCVSIKFNKMCIPFVIFRKREERQPLSCSSVVVAVNCSTYLPTICSATSTLFWWRSHNDWPNGCWDWEAFIFRHSVAPPSRHFMLGAELFFLVTLYILCYRYSCLPDTHLAVFSRVHHDDF